MTTDCTRCGATTADHMLTAISKMRRAEARSVQSALLCPRCYEDWWAAESGAAQSLASHPGIRGRRGGVAS